MSIIMLIIPIFVVLFAVFVGGLIFLVVHLTNKKNSDTKTTQPITSHTEITKSLSSVLKEHRIRCNMTQEFVAEQLDVSRQAVSKWENGTSDPSTSNLIALAKLYGVSADELPKAVQ